MKHATPEELNAYLRSELDDAAAWAIERHVASCARCADHLAVEAHLELALLEAASRPPKEARQSISRRRVSLMAAAACLLGWASLGHTPAYRGPDGGSCALPTDAAKVCREPSAPVASWLPEAEAEDLCEDLLYTPAPIRSELSG